MEALLVVPWQSAKYVWMLMTLQKYDFYREVTPMTRVYTHLEMIMFSFAVTVGKTFYIHIPRSVHKHGDLLVLMWIVYTPILLTTAGCFAEMAALMPAVGAHYHYCYSTICEFVAFLVGWHLIFAYTLMTLSKCKFLSEFIDHIFLNGWISRNLKFMDRQTFWFISIPGYVDIISAMLAISMAFQAFWAVKFTKSFVNILTAIGIIIILTHIVAFMAKMDFNHISIEDTSGNEKLIDTMYVIHGALVGYESLSVLGEESKNPTTTIPLSIMSSVRFAMVLYTVYTFCISICVKKNAGVDLDEYNPLGSIVILLDMPWLYWISTLGTICSLWASAYGSMFVAVRILYAMSRDGMIFRTFSRIDRYTWKPAIPAIIFGLITGFLVTFISMKTDIGFFSFITTKIMTTICLLITRYRCEKKTRSSEENEKPKEEEGKSWVLANYPEHKTSPTETTHSISMLLLYNSGTFYTFVSVSGHSRRFHMLFDNVPANLGVWVHVDRLRYRILLYLFDPAFPRRQKPLRGWLKVEPIGTHGINRQTASAGKEEIIDC
ncbi:unnamed protein product [Nezara viridula]|uniref:Amino acid permease/ SLC12A domain-containing protein n=1 Tax=Nezara viridula TaxID=85310 RepID=A0A9P0MK38_NEZVI|nr:unnamed protein product [Nezara viridula]